MFCYVVWWFTSLVCMYDWEVETWLWWMVIIIIIIVVLDTNINMNSIDSIITIITIPGTAYILNLSKVWWFSEFICVEVAWDFLVQYCSIWICYDIDILCIIHFICHIILWLSIEWYQIIGWVIVQCDQIWLS